MLVRTPVPTKPGQQALYGTLGAYTFSMLLGGVMLGAVVIAHIP
jgi:hypothetical protein